MIIIFTQKCFGLAFIDTYSILNDAKILKSRLILGHPVECEGAVVSMTSVNTAPWATMWLLPQLS